MKRIRKIVANTVLTYFILPIVTYASFHQVTTPPSSGGFRNPLKFQTISAFLNALLDVIILIGVPIVVFAVIYAGFLFVTAQGNVEKINTAKKVIVWTLVGAMLVLGAKAVALAIEGTVQDLTQEVHSEKVVLFDEPVEFSLKGHSHE